MAKTVERVADSAGMWWVREDGARKAKFRTRTEARLYASDGMAKTPAGVMNSLSREALLALFREHGQARMDEILRCLDPMDMRVVNLHVLGATQAEVAQNVGLSQPSVCYRLRQAVARILFLLDVPRLDPRAMREAITPYVKDPMDVLILVMFVETTSQSEVGRRIGASQGLVRHRIQRALLAMAGVPEIQVYYDAVVKTTENLNILNASRVKVSRGDRPPSPASDPGPRPEREATPALSEGSR